MVSLLNPNSPPFFLTTLHVTSPPPPPPPPPRFYYYISPFNFYYIHMPIRPNYTLIPATRLSLPPQPLITSRSDEAVPAKEQQNKQFSIKRERSMTACWKAKRQHQQQQQGRCSWKLSRKRKPAMALPPAEFEFKMEGEERRTTVMIKNIPNCFGKKKVVELLDKHCLKENQKLDGTSAPNSEFDFLYLPMDFWSGCNLGYAFVNFTSPVAAWRLFHELHQKNWDSSRGSRKICEVTYARIQGLPALMSHFKDSIFACASEDYLPVRFMPSRDGQRATDQQRIGKHVLKGPKMTV